MLDAARERGAAIAATPIPDTIKRVADGIVVSTIDRSKAWAAGTPQAFRADLLARALESGREATDEAALCELANIPVFVVPVSRLGFKITTREDLELAEAILEARREAREGKAMASRVGIGFDAHPFVDGRR